VTDVEIWPLEGERAMVGMVTVKVAAAEFDAESVAATVWPPDGAPVGMIKVAENEPVPDAVIEDGFVVTAVPAKVTVTAELGVKLEPVTVTEVPDGPLVGLKEIDEVVTVKVAVAEWLWASVA